MTLLAQDVIVTLLALAAAIVILWRVFGVFRPSKAGPCSTCASGTAACAKVKAPEQPQGTPVPLVLHRRS